MNPIKINRSELIEALTSRVEVIDESWFLDLATGKLLLIGADTDEQLDDIADIEQCIAIEPISAHESYQIMEDFVDQLEPGEASTRLVSALNHTKPFRHFKDTLSDFSELRETWFKFEEQVHTEIAAAWCKDQGLSVEWKS